MKLARVGVIAAAILAVQRSRGPRSRTSRARGHSIEPARRLPAAGGGGGGEAVLSETARRRSSRPRYADRSSARWATPRSP